MNFSLPEEAERGLLQLFPPLPPLLIQTVLGAHISHWCQLNVKASLEKAFRYCLVVSFLASDWECCPKGCASLAGGRAAIEVHFQPRGWKRDLTKLLA
ncbi:MAG: hypothetical protein RMY16_03935 [Nostoc sp. DedQUE12b]|uniref:hypothetical protein n=1 Tax=Nostoc sp. DedQUE12b TaxID=3075398 RepID=UPI002AD472EF|nr:hypothetical protein [Nostoc sp. DedQUE12b]MDZ8084736.1 hypothetical protein [Nostoc sp. DedQUE12b]